jgi:hypothetical protein
MVPPRSRGSYQPRYSARQLDWVLRNHTARENVAPVGREAEGVDLDACGSARAAREVYEAIRGMVDPPFRDVCRFDELRAGVVRILVVCPERRYDIPTLWQARLQRALAQMFGAGKVKRVEFRVVDGLDADHPQRAGVAF